MKYNKIIMLGTGKLFLDCMKHVKDQGLSYVGFDMSDKPQKMTQLQAEKNELEYHYEARKEVYEYIRRQEEKILLLSIINPCIIPGDILDKNNITAINCHQALLPEHKGRNAEAWAIFEGDKETGITWHKMTSAVDEGEILIQKKVEITDTITSLQLFLLQLQQAYNAFVEFLPEVLSGTEKYAPQRKGGSFRYSYETPEDGKLDLSWSGEKISRFLRALDYGGMSVMASPYFIWNEQKYLYKSYSIKRMEQKTDSTSIKFEDNLLKIEKEDYEILLKRCKIKQII